MKVKELIEKNAEYRADGLLFVYRGSKRMSETVVREIYKKYGNCHVRYFTKYVLVLEE